VRIFHLLRLWENRELEDHGKRKKCVRERSCEENDCLTDVMTTTAAAAREMVVIVVLNVNVVRKCDWEVCSKSPLCVWD
jgi:hypothetical protein